MNAFICTLLLAAILFLVITALNIKHPQWYAKASARPIFFNAFYAVFFSALIHLIARLFA